MNQNFFDTIILGSGAAGQAFIHEYSKSGQSIALFDAAFGGTAYASGALPVKMHLDAITLNPPADATSALACFLRVQRETQTFLRTQREIIKDQAIIIPMDASFSDSKTIYALNQYYRANQIIIATGSHTKFSSAHYTMQHVVDHAGLLNLVHIPKTLFIVGLGVEAAEFASVYASYGCKVTMCGLEDHLLFGYQDTLRKPYEETLSHLGVQILPKHRLIDLKEKSDGAEVVLEKTSEPHEICSTAAEYVLITGARIANIPVGFSGNIVDGVIKVNERFETSIPHIYALGDCSDISTLGSTAIAQAQNLGSFLRMGQFYESPYPSMFPHTVHGIIEISGAGSTQGIFATVPLSSTPRGFSRKHPGQATIICDPSCKNVTGIWFVAPNASDLSTTVAFMLEKGLTLNELYYGLFPHPSVGEALRACASKLIHSNIYAFLNKTLT